MNLGVGPSNTNPLTLTLTLRPLYMKMNLNTHPCGKHNSRGRMRTTETSIFFAWTVLPYNLKPCTRVGESRGPPGSLSHEVTWVFPGKVKKINAFRFWPFWNPSVTSRNVYLTLVVWGIPIRFNSIGRTPSGGTSRHVCPSIQARGGWLCQRVGVQKLVRKMSWIWWSPSSCCWRA